jgi:hypothetical protein
MVVAARHNRPTRRKFPPKKAPGKMPTHRSAEFICHPVSVLRIVIKHRIIDTSRPRSRDSAQNAARDPSRRSSRERNADGFKSRPWNAHRQKK